ncbi:ATP synthase F1 subunit gamma [Paludibaculum fermentans]|uniref:ATP synthase F1 subunit gamma n=1 Tax=Paludibaculum fermentans TaxID=1473598 RepID=UPI003EBBF7E3
MPSLIDIRRRIRSVKNTQQITKAMKMVATARLRRAQERVINARPYSRMAGEILRNVAAAAAGDERVGENPLLAVREEKRIQFILITSDRGLAGGFNSNLIKAAQQFLTEHAGQEVQMELYGRKARDFFIRRPVKVSGEITGISQAPTLADAKALADKITDRFKNEEVDAVYLLYNEFKSVLTQKVTLKKLLPMAVQADDAPQRDYIFEQPPAEMLGRLLPNYILLQILEAFLESAAAEHAARMTAMDAASTNANDVINKLTLYMNRVRQASITREIIEVVSGASALE